MFIVVFYVAMVSLGVSFPSGGSLI